MLAYLQNKQRNSTTTRWVHVWADLADGTTKRTTAMLWEFLETEDWSIVFDENQMSGKTWHTEGHGTLDNSREWNAVLFVDGATDSGILAVVWKRRQWSWRQRLERQNNIKRLFDGCQCQAIITWLQDDCIRSLTSEHVCMTSKHVCMMLALSMYGLMLYCRA